jgi:NADPH:quinone reductase-like Zn-dependent oxidoreductase
MKAYVLRSYGSTDQLHLTEVDTPVPGEDEVLVRVRATSVNPYDWHNMRGEPYVARMMPGGPGLRSPRLRVLGCDMAGRVEAVGRGVTGFRPGDDVYALLEQGGFAEYAVVPERLLARMPGNLSYEQAAAVPMAGVTALVAVRDRGRVQAGQAVLVNGASGGVGTFAVQIARALGARVTGVCGTRNVELVRSIGADEVIDYRTATFPNGGRRYDVLVDVAGSRSLSAYRRALTPKGTLVLVGGPASRWWQPAGHMFAVMARGPFVSQRIVLADAVAYPTKQQALETLTALIERGDVAPVIDRHHAFAEIPTAVRYQEEGHAPGKVVVSV